MSDQTPEEIALARIRHAQRSKATELSLVNIGLTLLPAEIKRLKFLKELSIWANKIQSLPPEIGELQNLEVLKLGITIYGSNPLEVLPPEIGKLKNLKELHISQSRLHKLPPEIVDLKNLEVLDVSGNYIESLPPQFSQLNKLRILKLGTAFVINIEIDWENYAGNWFTTFPIEIIELTELKELNLSGNRISFIPPEIQLLQNLEGLFLGGTQLNELPPEITRLKHLQKLTLDDNNLSIFPPEVLELTNLRVLTINNNQIETLPTAIQKLQNLEYFSISHNQLKEFPIQITSLRKLGSLDIAWNKMNRVPREIRDLERLKILDLRGNSIEDVPSEILYKITSPKEIIDYILAESKRQLNESKLIFIGEGSVGKTSLVNRILQGTFDPHQSKTDGIAINHWQIEERGKHEADSFIKINIWDFGGQEIMHATHQFFLTKRSLYLLVLDSRLTQEENRVEYWLKIIQSFGGESPVLIVGNKIDQHPLDIDRTGLQKKYPNSVGILETSAATGAGIEELKAAITEQVNNLPHVRDLLPETWFTVKTKLEELGRKSNFITYDKYLELCSENEVNDEASQRTLIGFLHDLGVVLHFQDDPRLEALGILNPQWVTNGVYKILNSHALFQNKGLLTVSSLDEILNLPEYPRGKRLFIVDMMKKFELCYDLEPDKTFLVPDLLPKDQPDLKFNGVPAFEYAYPVLPSSVITRFIVRMNQHIHEGIVWRTGVLLEIGENLALVKADIEDRKITIAIDGLEHTRRDALSAIRYQLDEIHASIKGLDAQKRAPIPSAPNAEPLEYEYLLMLEREGQETHLVKDGSRLVKINVREVLSGIESEAQRRETGGNVTNIYIGGDVKGSTIISGDNNIVLSQKIQESVKKAETSSIPPELMETLKLLGEALDLMNKVLPKEQAAETTEDFGKLVDEATKPAPQKKWYSVSVDGLIKAAENVEKVGEPVIKLSRKVLSLLTGG